MSTLEIAKTDISKSTVSKGVLLLQMGGPANLEEIEPFLFNLFRDKYIIQLPWFMKSFQESFARVVSRSRAPKVAEQYKQIGGGSPIKFETESQAKALAQQLNRERNPEIEIKAYYAMRYTYPFLNDALKDMQADGINELTVIPLYPQYSIATTGSSLIECKELFEQSDFNKQANIKYIESWHDNEDYIRLIYNRIQDKLAEFNQEGIVDPRRIHILFSAHGLPESYIENGDPYQEQIKQSISKVMGRLPMYKHSLAYQSKVGPVKWLEPATDTKLKKLAKEQLVENVLVVPISFVGDHIETMFELAIEYAHVAKEAGIKKYKVTRLPKANKLLINALASFVD